VASAPGGQKVLGVVFDVAFDRIEIVQNFRLITIRGAYLLNQIRDRKGGGLAIERTHRVATLALPSRHLIHHRRTVMAVGFVTQSDLQPSVHAEFLGRATKSISPSYGRLSRRGAGGLR